MKIEPKKIKILIVEDSPNDVFLMKQWLSETKTKSYDLIFSDSLQQAFQYLKRNNIDVILLDLGLPDSTGIDTFYKIAAFSPQLPIIVVSGSADNKTAIKAVKDGAQDYLAKKDMNTNLILKSIRYAIERKKILLNLENSENNFRSLIEKNADPIVVINLRGIIQYINSAAEVLLGCNLKEVNGEPFGIPLVSDGLSKISLIQNDGTKVIVEINKAKIIWKGESAYLLSFRNITEREKQLQKTADDLEYALEKLKLSQAQFIEAEKLAALGTLTAGIAHELNNPMMGMLNFVQYCIKKVKNKKISDVLDDMQRETKRCIAIVKNLLTFSRVEKEGEEKFQLENCVTIIERTYRLLIYRIGKENVKFSLSAPPDLPKIYLKVNNIQQVFLNLMGNALDALKTSDKKELRVEIDSEKNNIVVTILDTGQGIDPAYMGKIFDPFFTTKPPGKGTGLGLSVCQSIIKDHAGNITVDSQPQQGTSFKIRLPIKQKPKLIKALIVDDETSFNQLLVKTLQRTGKYQIEGVNNGSSALIKLGTFLPDILVLDINMPEMDGLEVCQAIKNEIKLQNLLVIIVTGYRNDPRIEKIKTMGFDNIEYKPLDLPQFLKDIERLIGLDRISELT